MVTRLSAAETTLADSPAARPHRTTACDRKPDCDLSLSDASATLFPMRSLVLIVLRVVLEFVLMPIRLALALGGAVAVLFGALGAVAWTIQLMVSGSGGGAFPPALMWLLSIAAVPVGLGMLVLAWIGVEDPPAPVGPADSPSSWGRAQPDVLLDTEERSTTVVPELHTSVRMLVAAPEQAARLRRASRAALRRTRRRRPL
jgi:hypothetical protein